MIRILREFSRDKMWYIKIILMMMILLSCTRSLGGQGSCWTYAPPTGTRTTMSSPHRHPHPGLRRRTSLHAPSGRRDPRPYSTPRTRGCHPPRSGGKQPPRSRGSCRYPALALPPATSACGGALGRLGVSHSSLLPWTGAAPSLERLWGRHGA